MLNPRTADHTSPGSVSRTSRFGSQADLCQRDLIGWTGEAIASIAPFASHVQRLALISEACRRTEAALRASTRNVAWKASSASWLSLRIRRQTAYTIGACRFRSATKAHLSPDAAKRSSSCAMSAALNVAGRVRGRLGPGMVHRVLFRVASDESLGLGRAFSGDAVVLTGDRLVGRFGPLRLVRAGGLIGAAGFGAEVKRRILLGTFVLSSGYYDAYYLRAQKVRTLVRRDFEEALREVDVLCSPVSPTPAFRLGERVDDPLAMYLSDVYTLPASLAGVPAMSVPCAPTRGGLPVGLQIIARPLDEATMLAVGAACEHMHPPAEPWTVTKT